MVIFHMKQWSFKNVTISFVEDVFGRLAKISICWGNSHFIYLKKKKGQENIVTLIHLFRIQQTNTFKW